MIRRNIIMLLAAVMAVCAGCGRKEYVVVQVADAQLGFASAAKAQAEGTVDDNDLSYEAGYLQKAVEAINNLRPDAVVFTGDQVNHAGDQKQWDTFARIIADIDASVKVFHLPGNHDIYIKGNEVDSTPFVSRYGQDRFVSREKGVTLAGINTSLIKHDDVRENEQLEWLEEVLGQGRKDQVTILFGHHPFFMTDIEESDGYFQIQKAKRQRYFSLFEEKGVDAVYAGHRHNNSEGSYGSIPMKTTTSAAFQIGDAQPSVRVITVKDGTVSDILLPL